MSKTITQFFALHVIISSSSRPVRLFVIVLKYFYARFNIKHGCKKN